MRNYSRFKNVETLGAKIEELKLTNLFGTPSKAKFLKLFSIKAKKFSVGIKYATKFFLRHFTSS